MSKEFETRTLANLLREIKGRVQDAQTRAASSVNRNIKRMLAFHRAYPKLEANVPQPAAHLADSLLRAIPWFRHVSEERWILARDLPS